ncbi:MAG: glycine/betaine/sarcosine/D-proline family reductase selenoprotein B [Chloroflexi bacterium]|nr:glycine/betaine/sarcosine/D-proline family reductase selenoprotein B [Chloroflexota bacterium]
MATPGKLRFVHYLNQFFGGIGAEEHANAPFQVKEGAIGPARLAQQLLGGQAEVVATFICGDNHFVEETSTAIPQAKEALRSYAPDLVLAGPAFDAGRYGVACAQMCRLAKTEGIPSVTGMFPENPGYTTYRRDLICVPTGTQPTEMQAVLSKMAALGLKLARGEKPGPAADEGYLPTGLRLPVVRGKPAWERAIEMVEDLVSGRPHTSEVLIQQYETVPIPPPVRDLGKLTLGLVTSGGLVPRGNPDRQVSSHSESAFRYSIQGVDTLSTDDWESVHGGFNTTYLNTKNPSYVLPLPVLRELEREEAIGGIYPYFFSTVGNGTPVTNAKRMGVEIAREFRDAGIEAALLVAT